MCNLEGLGQVFRDMADKGGFAFAYASRNFIPIRTHLDPSHGYDKGGLREFLGFLVYRKIYAGPVFSIRAIGMAMLIWGT